MTSEWCIYLNSQIEVLLNELFVALGPVADAVVHFEHTRVPSKWQGRMTRVQPGPESSSVHSLSKVDLFCDNAHWLVLSKILLGQEILLEHQPGTLDILLFCVYLDGDSWRKKGVLSIRQSSSQELNFIIYEFNLHVMFVGDGGMTISPRTIKKSHPPKKH